MRIAFATSCLQPGKDGVGDYTRDLAGACVRAGCRAVIVALNDTFVDGAPRFERQNSRGTDIDVLRLAAGLSWTSRVATAAPWLTEFSPDWLSLQFVPHGFHPKGLIGNLGRHLQPLCEGRRVQVMFHETWMGAARGSIVRHRIIGLLQRSAVMHMVLTLRPVIAHTSNSAYVAMLARAGIGARVLPLFGNIPAVDVPAGWMAGELLRAGVAQDCVKPRNASWWFGTFGSLHPEWEPEPLFSYISAAAAQSGRKVVIAAIGRQPGRVNRWQALQEKYSRSFTFCLLGERTSPEVSWYLQSLDFGLATTSWKLIGKSGTAAAMLEHGLPVIVSRDDADFSSAVAGAVESPDPLLYRMDSALPRWLHVVRRRNVAERLSGIAAQYLADLAAAGKVS
jgi:hypothetical protein